MALHVLYRVWRVWNQASVSSKSPQMHTCRLWDWVGNGLEGAGYAQPWWRVAWSMITWTIDTSKLVLAIPTSSTNIMILRVGIRSSGTSWVNLFLFLARYVDSFQGQPPCHSFQGPVALALGRFMNARGFNSVLLSNLLQPPPGRQPLYMHGIVYTKWWTQPYSSSI